MGLKEKVFILFAFGFLLFFPATSFAAEVWVEVKPFQEKEMVANLFVSSDESLNAAEGRMLFPSDLLELKEIRDGGSVVSLWVEKPKMESEGKISFSGIMPGGFKGKDGLIFSAIFTTKKNETGEIRLEDFKLLKNDGFGTASYINYYPARFAVNDNAENTTSFFDRFPPDSFKLVLARDERIFDNKWFIAFETKDKESGVSGYEVKEMRPGILSRFQKWLPAKSPYQLRDQELKSYVLIKAIDNTGKERFSELLPQKPLSWFEKNMLWIFGGTIASIIFVSIIIWTKKRS